MPANEKGKIYSESQIGLALDESTCRFSVLKRDEKIAKSLALKQRLKERDLEERGDYMDRRRELQEKLNLLFQAIKKWQKILQVS